MGRVRANSDIQGGGCRYVSGARRSRVYLADVQQCGVAKFDASRQERNRIRFRCPDCGNDLNRSVNAAKNILVRGLAEPVLSAGESVIAGRASMEEITPEMSGVRPENHVST